MSKAKQKHAATVRPIKHAAGFETYGGYRWECECGDVGPAVLDHNEAFRDAQKHVLRIA